MSTATNEEWEEVVAVDGNTYRVLRNPPPPNPPLPVTESESRALNAAIKAMARVAVERGIRTDRPRFVNDDVECCKKIDALIVETLKSLRADIKSDPAEKLFERLMDVCDSWEDENEALCLGTIFIRLFDTMEHLVSYRRKFRGVDRKYVKHSKDEAHQVLRERGLTKR